MPPPPPPTPIHITAENIGILTYSNSQDIYHSFWTQHSQPNSEATMQKAGIPGFKTNHSLCVTSANEVVSEWNATYTMSRTGHRSVQGVCTYKRIYNDQRQTISPVLNAKQYYDFFKLYTIIIMEQH